MHMSEARRFILVAAPVSQHADSSRLASSNINHLAIFNAEVVITLHKGFPWTASAKILSNFLSFVGSHEPPSTMVFLHYACNRLQILEKCEDSSHERKNKPLQDKKLRYPCFICFSIPRSQEKNHSKKLFVLELLGGTCPKRGTAVGVQKGGSSSRFDSNRRLRFCRTPEPVSEGVKET